MNLRKLMSLFAVLVLCAVFSVASSRPAHAYQVFVVDVVSLNGAGDVISETTTFVDTNGNGVSATTEGPAAGDTPVYMVTQVQTDSGFNSGPMLSPAYTAGGNEVPDNDEGQHSGG